MIQHANNCCLPFVACSGAGMASSIYPRQKRIISCFCPALCALASRRAPSPVEVCYLRWAGSLLWWQTMSRPCVLLPLSGFVPRASRTRTSPSPPVCPCRRMHFPSSLDRPLPRKGQSSSVPGAGFFTYKLLPHRLSHVCISLALALLPLRAYLSRYHILKRIFALRTRWDG